MSQCILKESWELWVLQQNHRIGGGPLFFSLLSPHNCLEEGAWKLSWAIFSVPFITQNSQTNGIIEKDPL